MKRRLTQGFTLVELLVVLVIVGIMAGVVVARFPSFTLEEEFLRESERIRVVIEMLRDEAVISSTEYAFVAEDDTYAFHLYNEIEQIWVESTQAPFITKTLPEGVALYLRVEEQGVTLGRESEESEPPVLVLSSGEVTPFELRVVRESDRAERVLRSDGYDRLSWDGEEDGYNRTRGRN